MKIRNFGIRVVFLAGFFVVFLFGQSTLASAQSTYLTKNNNGTQLTVEFTSEAEQVMKNMLARWDFQDFSLNLELDPDSKHQGKPRFLGFVNPENPNRLVRVEAYCMGEGCNYNLYGIKITTYEYSDKVLVAFLWAGKFLREVSLVEAMDLPEKDLKEQFNDYLIMIASKMSLETIKRLR